MTIRTLFTNMIRNRFLSIYEVLFVRIRSHIIHLDYRKIVAY